MTFENNLQLLLTAAIDFLNDTVDCRCEYFEMFTWQICEDAGVYAFLRDIGHILEYEKTV